MIFHDISVGLFLPTNCHQVLRMCAFLFQLKFSEGVDCCGEEPPPSNLRRDHTGAGIPREARLCRKTMNAMNDMCKQLKNMEHEWPWLCHIMAYYGILSFFRMKFLWRFFEVASSDDISRFRQLAVQVLRVNPQQTQWRLPMTDPWCCHIYVCIYMPYMVTWIPSIYPSHVSINIPAPWIRHGAHHSIIFYDIYSYQRLPVLYTTPQHHHSKATLLALLRRLRRLMMNSSIRNLAMKNWFIWKLPICSMYGIFTNIYPINHPNVGKYTIHGAYGLGYDVWFYSKLY